MSKHVSHAAPVSEFSATVVDIREESRTGARQRWHLALDCTEFAAAAGKNFGVIEAVTPRGARLLVPVLDVVMDGAGEIWHVVEKPLATGTHVTAHVGAAEFERSATC